MTKAFAFLVFLLLTTTAIVISEDNNDQNQVALLVDEIPSKVNITCLCTEGEQCDGDSRTCQLSHPHHTCYESWTLEPNDGSIAITAG
jgi:hypothetical protein